MANVMACNRLPWRHQDQIVKRSLELVLRTVLKPKLEARPPEPDPKGEPILPIAVVDKTRNYIEHIVRQANACYEANCFDACSVMIRKLVEILIIELFEAKNKANEIKDSAGDYVMLNGLIQKLLTETSWNLGRETKRALPLIKELGDRSAHNRRFLARKADVDKLTSGLRVVTDDLLHLAGLK